MCGRYFLELKALMELEERIDYTFERDLLIAKIIIQVILYQSLLIEIIN